MKLYWDLFHLLNSTLYFHVLFLHESLSDIPYQSCIPLGPIQYPLPVPYPSPPLDPLDPLPLELLLVPRG